MLSVDDSRKKTHARRRRGPVAAINARAAHTIDPLRLPGAPAGQTTAARRWRDLVSGYAELIGPDRLARPDVRARLSALVSIQLMLEGLEAQVARGEVVGHSALVQGSQQLGKLLSELGLETAAAPRDETPNLGEILRKGHRIE